MKRDAFVCIRTVLYPQDVALIHSVLSGTGILYYIENENVVHTNGFAVNSNLGMRLMVESDNEQQARELLMKRGIS